MSDPMKSFRRRLLSRVAECGLFLSCCLSATAIQAQQADRQPLDDIAQAVSDFVQAQTVSAENVQVDVRALDQRLRLARCEDRLEADWSPGSRRIGRVTVQVSCSAEQSWRVHVQATVSLEGEVWVLARPVERGEELDRSSLTRKSIRLGSGNSVQSSLASPILDLAPWQGYAFARRVAAGKVLDERMLKPALLIHKGEAVLVRIDANGLKLQTKGVALASAAAGRSVQVRNSSSGKIIDAIAVGKGVVAVRN